MDIIKKLFGWAMYKGIKDGKANLPETPTKPGNEKPWYRIDAFTIEKRRWRNDIRWYGWARGIYNFFLYAIYMHIAMFVFKNYFDGDTAQVLVWGFSLMVVSAWLMLFKGYYLGWIQDNSIWYDKAHKNIVPNENSAFSVYRDYHLRDFLVKMIYPLGFVIADFIAHNGQPHVIATIEVINNALILLA